MCDSPTDDGLSVTFRPARGPRRRVHLCAHCRTNRPGRDRDELLADDHTWALLERETTILADAYRTGVWLPCRDEYHWAQTLARTTWTQSSVEQTLRNAGEHVRAGCLMRVMELLPHLLALVDDQDRALRPARELLATLTDDPS
nr:hypothetical protein [Streptomyces sp. SID3343]